MERRAAWQHSTFYAIVLGGVIALFGVLFLGWGIGTLILFYVIDAVLVFLFTGLMYPFVDWRKALLAVPLHYLGGGAAMVLACFFALGIAALLDTGKGMIPDWLETIPAREIYLSTALLAAGHLASFVGDFLWKRAFRRTTWEQVRNRMGMLALTYFLVWGGLAMLGIFGSVALAAALIIAGKTALELAVLAHRVAPQANT